LEEASRSVSRTVHDEVSEAMTPVQDQLERVRRKSAEDIARAEAGEEEARRSLASEMAQLRESEVETRMAAKKALERAEHRVQDQVSETVAMLKSEQAKNDARRAKEEKIAKARLEKTEASHRQAKEAQRLLEQQLQLQREEDMRRAEREMRLQLELKAEQRELQWKAEHRELELKSELKQMRWQSEWQAVQQLEDSELLRKPSSSREICEGRSPGKVAGADLRGDDSIGDSSSTTGLPRSCSRFKETLFDHIAASQDDTDKALGSGRLSSWSVASTARPFSERKRSMKMRADAKLAENVAADLDDAPEDADRASHVSAGSGPGSASRSGHASASQRKSGTASRHKRPSSAGSRPSSAGTRRGLAQQNASVAENFSKWYVINRASAKKTLGAYGMAKSASSIPFEKGNGRLSRGYRPPKAWVDEGQYGDADVSQTTSLAMEKSG